MTYSNAPTPRPPTPRNKNMLYVIGGVAVIAILAVIFFLDRPHNTAQITVEPPAATGTVPATPTQPTTP